MTGSAEWLLPTLAIAALATGGWIQRARPKVLEWAAAHAGVVGGIAAAIGVVALCRAAADANAADGLIEMEQAAADFGFVQAVFAVLGMVAGAAVLAGSLVVLARLRGLAGTGHLRGHRIFGRALCLAAALLGTMIVFQLDERLVGACLLAGLALGGVWALPWRAAELPWAIWTGSSIAGIALALDGFAVHSVALGLAGVLLLVNGARQLPRAGDSRAEGSQ